MTKTGFDWKTFIKSIAIIAIPVALQNLLTTTGSMVDTVMVSSLGELSVGALGLCAQFSTLMFSSYWGFVGGGLMFFSQYWGSKDDAGINRSYGMMLSCMITVSIIFFILARFFPGTIMALYTNKTDIQRIGIQYLRIVAFSYPLQILSMAMSCVLRSTEKVRIPLYSSIISVCTNIFFNWVFIHGNLGAPKMGIEGAALATVIAGITNVAVMIVLAKFQNYKYIFNIRSHFKWTKKATIKYFKKCFPIICNEFFFGVGNMVINMVLGRQSEHVIAALAVFRTLEGLVIGFFAGISSASSILVGNCVGSGQLKKAYDKATRLVFLCAGCIFVVCSLLVVFHKPILTGMHLTGEAYNFGVKLLFIYCIVAVIRMCNWVQNDTYRSAGDSAFGSIMEISFLYLLVLPAVFVTGMVLKLPFLIVFISCYIDEPIRFIIMQVHMYSGKWIKPVTKQGEEALKDFLNSKRKIKN